MAAVKTPCVGICSTVYGDAVCRGCKRYSHEIIAWNRYSSSQKLSVYRRLNVLAEQVMRDKLVVMSKQALLRSLEHLGVRYIEHHSPYVWAYELLRALNLSQVGSLIGAGISVKPAYQALSLSDLKQQTEQELLQLAEAHYERFVVSSYQRG